MSIARPQEVHRDHSLLTCLITLNERREYSEGGTWLEAVGRAFAPPRERRRVGQG